VIPAAAIFARGQLGADLLLQLHHDGEGAAAEFEEVGRRDIFIPLPPLSEQERIVSILDRFDKLCNDIREGLPAEIDLRQKQYEHYRDRLLTFEAAK
jgi:type I restriction enzyme S subunit